MVVSQAWWIMPITAALGIQKFKIILATSGAGNQPGIIETLPINKLINFLMSIYVLF